MDFFLLIMEGRSKGSIANGYSIWMKMSSAGARSKAPPQVMQPFVFSTTLCISSIDRLTGHRTSTRSAVPAAEVTARDDVFGMVKPAAAMIGTTRILGLSTGL